MNNLDAPPKTARHVFRRVERFTRKQLVPVAFYIFPLLTLYGVFLLFQGRVSSLDITLFVVMYSLSVIGFSLGYHRMEAHKSFKPHPVVRFILLALGAMAFNGPPSYWISFHMRHHARSDKDGDPHSPVHGFFHSHFKWIFTADWKAVRKDYEVRFKHDKMLKFFDETLAVWVVLGFLIPFIIGGWSGLLWGGAIRMFVADHAAFAVNSWVHTNYGGTRAFDTDDNSRNNPVMGLIAMGDGWHNNHHAFPRSAYHGFHWYQIDINGYIISLLNILGLVSDVQRVSKDKIKRKQLASG